jgi:hypothetical protein
MRHTPKEEMKLDSLARAHTKEQIQTLCAISRNGTNESARVAAAIAILDRGHGKPKQVTVNQHTGLDGEGPIVVEIIQHAREKK